MNKKRRSILLIILAISSLNISFGQQMNMIGPGFGLSDFHIIDEHTSPLIFRGVGITPSLEYHHWALKSIYSLEGTFYYDNLKSNSGNFNTENFRAGGRFSYYHSMMSQTKSRRFMAFVGGSLTSFFCKSDYYFYLQNFWARSICSWYWGHSVDLAVMTIFSISDKSSLWANVTIPVISNVSRPSFSPSGNYNYIKNDWTIRPFGKTEFVPENFIINTGLTYQHLLSRKISFRIKYEFYYLSCSHPESVYLYMNNFRALLLYCF